MAQRNVELRHQRGQIAKQMEALLEKRGGLTAGDKAEFDRLERESRDVRDEIQRIEQSNELYKEVRRTGKPPEGDPSFVSDAPLAQADREKRQAFGAYLRRGRADLSPSELGLLDFERRDMGDAGLGAYFGATGGAVLVPVGFQHEIEVALKTTGPMLDPDTVRFIDTESGQPLPYPTENDTAILGELIGENQQVTSADVNLSTIMFGAWKFSSRLVKVSLELVQDSAFDLEAFLTQTFAVRMGRVANSYLTNGTGGQQPNGIIPATLAGGLTVTAAGSFTNDGVGGANTIGSDDLINLEHAIDPLYRTADAAYMMHDSTLRQLRTLKDKFGHPLWVPAITEGKPDLLNGYRVRINNFMDSLQLTPSSPAVTRNTILFGPLKKYAVRRVKEFVVMVLRERFMDFGQLAYIGWMRLDGQLLDAGTHPTALLQNVY